MVVDTLSLLLSQLNQYLQQANEGLKATDEVAILGNIAQFGEAEEDTGVGCMKSHIVLTVVNLEEEGTMKNGSTFTRGSEGTVNYQNPPLHLNLFLLFTATHKDYVTALKLLTLVLKFFQGKQKFTLRNSPGSSRNSPPITELSLTLDLLSLSFEELNHLWGSLGGKQWPFVLYRGRLVTIGDGRILEGGGLIQEIDVTSGVQS